MGSKSKNIISNRLKMVLVLWLLWLCIFFFQLNFGCFDNWAFLCSWLNLYFGVGLFDFKKRSEGRRTKTKENQRLFSFRFNSTHPNFLCNFFFSFHGSLQALQVVNFFASSSSSSSSITFSSIPYFESPRPCCSQRGSFTFWAVSSKVPTESGAPIRGFCWALTSWRSSS